MQILRCLSFAVFCAAAAPNLFALGQAPPESRDRWNREEQAAKAVEALRRNYVGRDLAGFFEHVSDEYRRGWADLRSDLADQRRDFSSVDLHFSANQTVVEGDKTAVQIRWQKRAMAAQTGQSQISEGSAEFVFQINPEGKAELIDIRGQSPF